jgi:endoglucanase
MRLRAVLGVLTACVVLAGCSGDKPDTPIPTQPPAPTRVQVLPNPIQGKAFYADRGTQAHKLLAGSKAGSREQKALRVITSRPTATWLTGSIHDAAAVTRVTSGAAASPNTVALLTFYNQPYRDSCSGSSSGGAANKETFLRWNQQMIDAMQGSKTAVVVFAPDALAEIAGGCLYGEKADDRIAMFATAIQALMASPHVALTCIDAGHPGWIDGPAINRLLSDLWRVGVNQAGCISLNVSNAYSNQANLEYMAELNNRRIVEPMAALIDTSRNGGNTPPNGKWCNVPGRKLGAAPTTKTNTSPFYAYAYVKRPGQSDGNGEGCNPGDKPAGEFDMKQAVSLARDEID